LGPAFIDEVVDAVEAILVTFFPPTAVILLSIEPKVSLLCSAFADDEVVDASEAILVTFFPPTVAVTRVSIEPKVSLLCSAFTDEEVGIPGSITPDMRLSIV